MNRTATWLGDPGLEKMARGMYGHPKQTGENDPASLSQPLCSHRRQLRQARPSLHWQGPLQQQKVSPAAQTGALQSRGHRKAARRRAILPLQALTLTGAAVFYPYGREQGRALCSHHSLFFSTGQEVPTTAVREEQGRHGRSGSVPICR